MESDDTPAVRVGEQAAVAAPVVGVATAIPAFIGYTQRAQDPASGRTLTGCPTPIDSAAAFEACFGGGAATMFRLEPADDDAGPDIVDPDGAAQAYRLVASSGPFRLFESIQLFYDNGGGPCLIVSVGGYDGAAVSLAALEAGLQALSAASGPTILAAPDAAALPPADAPTFAAAMIAQASALADRVALIDALPGESVGDWTVQLPAIEAFMAGAGAGTAQRSFGIAYFPFIDTTLHSPDDITYLNLAGDAATRATVARLLATDAAGLNGGTIPAPLAAAIASAVAELGTPLGPDPARRAAVAALNAELLDASPSLRQIEAAILGRMNRLPPSAAIAGVYAAVDDARGVWEAPANVSLNAVTAPAVAIGDDQQADLNVPASGMAVNAIRPFAGLGTVVWGARTMDGDSQDYRYIQARRASIYVSQSIEQALRAFAARPNDPATWLAVTAMISGFLTDFWKQGALQAKTAAQAFDVQCGLGSTMTAQDMVDGRLVAQAKLALNLPDEFVVLSFVQAMQQSPG